MQRSTAVARFGLASLMAMCVPLTVAAPARADVEYETFMSAPQIADITLAPGQSAELPVPLSVLGNYDAEGAFVAIQTYGKSPLTLTGPTGATCTGDVQLICYLPEVITPGQTSETWGASNPFRVTAPLTAKAGTYPVGLHYMPANTSYRNVGRNRDGSWKITPTLPITQWAWSGDHTHEDQSLDVTVTAGATPTPSPSAAQPTPTPTPTRQSPDGDGTVQPTGTSSPGGGAGGGSESGGGLPVTGTPVTALTVGGLLLLVVGATVVGLARRRRTRIVVE
ncbi:hypothetical protein ACFY3B_13445 [Micromonospora parva]|uniref:LPXTG-motif cell wall anchor domain-containing protein n=1 Tax=Micromonospora parva TaxID=1464048 RepID=A0ABW6VSI5_9ACTN